MTYYEWIETFDYLKTSPRDTQLLEKLQHSNLYLHGNILYRFINQLNELIRTRLKNTLDDFLFKIKNIYQDLNSLSLEIVHIKKEIKFVQALTNLNVIPQENKDRFKLTLQSFADEIMESLEVSVKEFDTTGEALNIIKNSKINVLEDNYEL